MLSTKRDTITDLLASIDENENGCWLLRDNTDLDSPGYVKVGGRRQTAHRAMYEQFNGPIPQDFCVRQTCGCLRCCRPGHLTAVIWAAAIRRRRKDAEEAAAIQQDAHAVPNVVIPATPIVSRGRRRHKPIRVRSLSATASSGTV